MRFEIVSKYCYVSRVLCFWCDERWNSSWMSDMGSDFLVLFLLLNKVVYTFSHTLVFMYDDYMVNDFDSIYL